MYLSACGCLSLSLFPLPPLTLLHEICCMACGCSLLKCCLWWEVSAVSSLLVHMCLHESPSLCLLHPNVYLIVCWCSGRQYSVFISSSNASRFMFDKCMFAKYILLNHRNHLACCVLFTADLHYAVNHIVDATFFGAFLGVTESRLLFLLATCATLLGTAFNCCTSFPELYIMPVHSAFVRVLPCKLVCWSAWEDVGLCHYAFCTFMAWTRLTTEGNLVAKLTWFCGWQAHVPSEVFYFLTIISLRPDWATTTIHWHLQYLMLPVWKLQQNHSLVKLERVWSCTEIFNVEAGHACDMICWGLLHACMPNSSTKNCVSELNLIATCMGTPISGQMASLLALFIPRPIHLWINVK